MTKRKPKPAAPKLPPLKRVKVRIWHGCYDKKWPKKDFPPGIFSHPAKFSYGLISRIYEDGLKRGAFRKGEAIGDPFGGVAMGGYVAGLHGLAWIGQELEPEFHRTGELVLAVQALRDPAWQFPPARLILGDSRFFAENTAGIVTSPPYADSFKGIEDGIDWEKAKRDTSGGGEHQKPGRSSHSVYGATRGQIGHLREGKLSSIVGSPPYGTREDGGGIAQTGETTTSPLSRGTIAAFVASPPYETINSGNGGLNHLPATDGQQGGRTNGASQTADSRYGDTPGQIAKCRPGGIEAVARSTLHGVLF